MPSLSKRRMGRTRLGDTFVFVALFSSHQITVLVFNYRPFAYVLATAVFPNRDHEEAGLLKRISPLPHRRGYTEAHLCKKSYEWGSGGEVLCRNSTVSLCLSAVT
jgi:hypothetical protein